jgi:hypothetical protein
MAIRPRPRGACHRAAQLGDQRGGAAAVGQREVQVPVAPVDQPKAAPFEVLAGRLHQPLAGPAGTRPHPGQRRVQRDLDLVLQIQVRMREESQQARQILAEQLLSHRRVGNQVGCGWRQR